MTGLAEVEGRLEQGFLINREKHLEEGEILGKKQGGAGGDLSLNYVTLGLFNLAYLERDETSISYSRSEEAVNRS